MSALRRFPLLRLILVFLGAVALSGLLWRLAAYQYYSDPSKELVINCAYCHEPPNVPVGGFLSRSALHDAHVDKAFMQGTSPCAFCHTGTGDSPLLNSSGMVGGLGCIGCHGQPLAGGAVSGAGLRRHHALAGVPADPDGKKCVNCHANDPVPPPESTVPVYYARPEVIPKTPCNTDGKEDFWNRTTGLPDGRGLDNDGDLLFDFLTDPDCGASACVDLDQDGYGDPGDASCRNGAARDCDDTRASVYPGAAEAHDELDNDCNGEVDEIQNVGFHNPTSRLQLTWNPQAPAGQLYDAIRSDGAQFPATSPNSTCLTPSPTFETFVDDPLTLPPKTVFYYLVRNALVRDYGKMSNGALRQYTQPPFCP